MEICTFSVIYVQEIDEADTLPVCQSLDPRPANSEKQTQILSYVFSLGNLATSSTSLWDRNRAWYLLFSLRLMVYPNFQACIQKNALYARFAPFLF